MTPAREHIIRILETLTDISAAELGRRVGVSRERVRQILKDLGYPTARGKGRPFGSGLLPVRHGGKAGHLSKQAALRIVAEDLLGLGFAIFAPVRASKTCDLVAVDPHCHAIPLRVVTGRDPGQPRHQGRVDRLQPRIAIVSPDQQVRYSPPLKPSSRKRPARK